MEIHGARKNQRQPVCAAQGEKGTQFDSTILFGPVDAVETFQTWKF